MTHGFGFSFPNDSNDDGDDRENNERRGEPSNPFAAFGFGGNIGGQSGAQGQGGLGDMLNQFGQMLSGMGSSMNAQDKGDAVNFDLAARMARQRIGSTPAVSEADTRAAEESLRLPGRWVDAAPPLPPPVARHT